MIYTRIGKCNLKHLNTGETFIGKVGKHRIRNKAVIYTRIGKCNLKHLYTGETFNGKVGKHRLGTRQGCIQE